MFVSILRRSGHRQKNRRLGADKCHGSSSSTGAVDQACRPTPMCVVWRWCKSVDVDRHLHVDHDRGQLSARGVLFLHEVCISTCGHQQDHSLTYLTVVVQVPDIYLREISFLKKYRSAAITLLLKKRLRNLVIILPSFYYTDSTTERSMSVGSCVSKPPPSWSRLPLFPVPLSFLFLPAGALAITSVPAVETKLR